MERKEMLNQPYHTLDELMVMFNWSSKTTAIRQVKDGKFTLPDGSSGAYRMPGRTGEWRILRAAVDNYINTLEVSPPMVRGE